MTEEEREKLERQKDWVKARYNCTVEAIFSHLFDVVKCDVKLFNDLDRRTVYECTYAKDSTDVFLVLPIETSYGKNPIVRFSRHNKYMQISPCEGEDFKVTPQWHEDDLECKLTIDCDPKQYTCPQISQKAIGGLLFPESHFPSTLRCE